MIGVIGSDDSVSLVLQVAAEMGLANQVVGRSYRSADEVELAARDLDAICRVLLFTGRFPFASALAQDPALRATLDFVPHSAIDLYRTLALVMRDNEGLVPSFVVDTIEREVVEQVCQDLGLALPVDVLGLEIDGHGIRDPEEIVDFHVSAVRSGRAVLSLTCLGSVNQKLLALGLPVSRIEHTRSTLHHALTRAALAVRSSEAEGAQPTVALLRPAKGRADVTGTSVRQFARSLRGEAVALSDETWRIHTNYAALEHLLLTDQVSVPPDWEAGFGVGAVVSEAEHNARRALKLGQPGRGGVVTVLADGSVIGVETHGASRLRLRETDDLLLAHARRIGVRSITLSRLAVALRLLNPDSLTVRELAQAYGVEPRSAARLLARLEAAGIATVQGVDGAPGAGRPQLVYSVDVDRLLPRRS